MPRVLVVDDDADTLTFLGKMLSKIPADGVPTVTCAAADYALRTLGAFDIIIADLILPDGHDVDVVSRAKRKDGCSTVIMSGYDAPNDGLPDGVNL
jgi:DNA-binding response OmpR family regulator